jgi:hypothetical protein
MVGTLTVQNLQGPTSGANANKIIIPSGQTLDASGGTLVPSAGQVVQVVKSAKRTTSSNSSTTSLAEISSVYRVSLTPKFSDSFILLTFQAGFNVGNATRMAIDFMVGTQSDYSSMSRIDTTSVNESLRNEGTTLYFRRHSISQYYDGYSSTDTLYFTMYFARALGGGACRVNDNSGAAFLTAMEIAQ